MRHNHRVSNVVLGVAGGIAAYKAADLLRKLAEAGHDVTVVPTAAALQFVGAPTWAALSHRPVRTDVWTDADLAALPGEPAGLAHLLMVDNPAHHPAGDFRLDAEGLLHATGEPRLTYGGIGVFRRELLDGWRDTLPEATGTPARFKLRPLLEAAMHAGRLRGTRHAGRWTDVGTPERLAELDRSLEQNP